MLIASALLLVSQALPPVFGEPPILPLDPPRIGARAQLVTSITQFGVTWQFREPVAAGRFVNGDWWVLGPVELVRIDPQSQTVNGRTSNGSMINPSPRDGLAQGYDSAMYGKYAFAGSYSATLNVALGVSIDQPLHVEPGSSLVSTISNPLAGSREQLQTAAILTVLDAIPPPDSFRPPYSGANKGVRFNAAHLNWALLRRLPPVASTPTLASVERRVRRPWIDHVPTWAGGYTHPSENMPGYGRDMTDEIGTASLMLHLDFTPAEKRDLLVSLVQIGIDFYGVLTDGGAANWQAGGGHHSGRKWPILFAGAMLTNLPMAAVGIDPSLLFMGEDGQTFYVRETSPGVYNNGYGGYGPQHVGLPEWGIKHALDPRSDDEDWYADPYRVCCTANSWTGQLLAVRIMRGQFLWNHDALFDYQDRYVQMQKQNGGSVATSRFALDMWNAYRQAF